ncbi:MAG: efflux RND transporter periplasmic adaptor subunit, partial [Planctomycetaceae bacterium]|nr:efflux RND transporter periplasmic adaptor subunit [Planctomycetaceae bacterium]
MAGMTVFEWLASFKVEPQRQDESALRKTYSVSVFEARPADLQRVITAFGTARAEREVTVAAEVPGQIVEANRLRVGRAVSAPSVSTGADGQSERSGGDLLLRVDPLTYLERVIQARKLLAQDDVELTRLTQEHENNLRLIKTDQANLKTATIEYENAKQLAKRQVGTDSAVRKAELDMRRYEDAVIRLENEIRLFDVRKQQIFSRRDAHASDLEIAQLDLNRTEVRPPFSGVLSQVLVEQGQFVRAGDPLFRLTDPTRVEIPLSLQLSDYLEIGEVREQGTSVRVSMAENETAEPRWFSDPLRDVRQAPEADERTRTVKVYTEVDNTAQPVPLLPGTFVHARILGTVRKGVTVIPRDAVINGMVFIAVPVKNGIAESSLESTSTEPDSENSWTAVVERRPIRTGRTLQSLVVVESGIEPGDWIVMTNLDVIYDGARLRI